MERQRRITGIRLKHRERQEITHLKDFWLQKITTKTIHVLL